METKTTRLIAPKRKRPVLTSCTDSTVSLPSSPVLKLLPSHLPTPDFFYLQILTVGDLHHLAPCHGRRPGFTVCVLHSGASGPGTGEARALGQQSKEGEKPWGGCFSSNLISSR